MSKDSCAKGIKIFLKKKKKTKSENVVVNDIKISETERKSLIEYRKRYYEIQKKKKKKIARLLNKVSFCSYKSTLGDLIVGGAY